MIHVHNASAHPFTGWVRTTTDAVMPECGIVQGSPYRLGSQNGLRTRNIDLWVENMGAGHRWTIDTGNVEMMMCSPLPAMQTWHMTMPGGVEVPSGQPDAVADGAAWLSRHRFRHGMFVVDIWLRRYPDQPWLAHGVATVTNSDVTRPDLTAISPDLRVQMGDAVCHVFGAGVNAPLVPAGEPWGDGQSRVVYFTLCWLALMPKEAEMSTQAVAERFVTECGVERLYPEGNPVRLPS